MNGTTANNEPAKDESEANELKAALEEDLKDEESDTEKYMKLASHADEHYPNRGYGAILRGIAKEENQHRKHIKMILKDMCDRSGEE